MFELYDIFDNNEINVILLSIFVILLIIIVIGLAYYDYNMKQKLSENSKFFFRILMLKFLQMFT